MAKGPSTSRAGFNSFFPVARPDLVGAKGSAASRLRQRPKAPTKLMEVFTKILLVGAGGAVGANIRYWLGGWILAKLPPSSAQFPWHTMLVNISGSLVMGLFMGLFLELRWNTNWQLFVAFGVLGGYTTFSTFANEALRLLADKNYSAALFYIEGSAVFTVFAAWVGLVMARLILGGRV